MNVVTGMYCLIAFILLAAMTIRELTTIGHTRRDIMQTYTSFNLVVTWLELITQLSRTLRLGQYVIVVCVHWKEIDIAILFLITLRFYHYVPFNDFYYRAMLWIARTK